MSTIKETNIGVRRGESRKVSSNEHAGGITLTKQLSIKGCLKRLAQL